MQARCGSSQPMAMSPRVQHLAQLVADHVDDGLEVESPAMPCWMLLITASLGGALLGLLQQPLRLVEQARVLQRDALPCRRAAAAPRRRSGVSRSSSSTQATTAPRLRPMRHVELRRRCPAWVPAPAALLHHRPALVDARMFRARGASLAGPPVNAGRGRSCRGVTLRASNHDAHVSVANTSRSLSPTRSTIAWSSCAGDPAGCC